MATGKKKRLLTVVGTFSRFSVSTTATRGACWTHHRGSNCWSSQRPPWRCRITEPQEVRR